MKSPGSTPGRVRAARKGPLVGGVGVGFPQAHLLDLIVRRIARRLDGPTVGFGNQRPAVAERPLVGPINSGRPGAGRRANVCRFVDDPGHVCTDPAGRPSNLYCAHSQQVAQ